MFRTCTNQSCGSQHSAQQLLYCSTCSSPTQAVYGHGFYPPSHPDSHQLDHHYRQQAHTPISPEASRPVIAPQARKPLASLTHPGETWRGPPSVRIGTLYQPRCSFRQQVAEQHEISTNKVAGSNALDDTPVVVKEYHAGQPHRNTLSYPFASGILKE